MKPSRKNLEQQHIDLLNAIKEFATTFYPYQDDDEPVDPRFPLALGQIAGICMKAVSEYNGEHESKS